MRASTVLLGGGRSFLYPKGVWSPAGGWFNKAPSGWERSTAVAFGIMAVAALALHKVSASLERRPQAPIRPILSQTWCAHAAEDDPARFTRAE